MRKILISNSLEGSGDQMNDGLQKTLYFYCKGVCQGARDIRLEVEDACELERVALEG